MEEEGRSQRRSEVSKDPSVPRAAPASSLAGRTRLCRSSWSSRVAPRPLRAPHAEPGCLQMPAGAVPGTGLVWFTSRNETKMIAETRDLQRFCVGDRTGASAAAWVFTRSLCGLADQCRTSAVTVQSCLRRPLRQTIPVLSALLPVLFSMNLWCLASRAGL